MGNADRLSVSLVQMPIVNVPTAGRTWPSGTDMSLIPGIKQKKCDIPYQTQAPARRPQGEEL
jgi:hypothetical protein